MNKKRNSWIRQRGNITYGGDRGITWENSFDGSWVSVEDTFEDPTMRKRWQVMAYDADSDHYVDVTGAEGTAYNDERTSLYKTYREALKIAYNWMKRHRYNAIYDDLTYLEYIADKVVDGEELTDVETEIVNDAERTEKDLWRQLINRREVNWK
jgi:hypothetical protein